MNSTKLSTKIFVAAMAALSTLAAVPGFDDFVKSTVASAVHSHPALVWIAPFAGLVLAALHNPKKKDTEETK